jgi:hypothetical protein
MISGVKEHSRLSLRVGDSEGRFSVAVDDRRHKGLLLSLVCCIVNDVNLDRLGFGGVQFLESQNRPVLGGIKSHLKDHSA